MSIEFPNSQAKNKTEDESPVYKKVVLAAGLATMLMASGCDSVKSPVFQEVDSKEGWAKLNKNDFLKRNSFKFEVEGMGDDSKEMVERLVYDWMAKNNDEIKSVGVKVEKIGAELVAVTVYAEEKDGNKFRQGEVKDQIGRPEFFDQSLKSALEEALRQISK